MVLPFFLSSYRFYCNRDGTFLKDSVGFINYNHINMAVMRISILYIIRFFEIWLTMCRCREIHGQNGVTPLTPWSGNVSLYSSLKDVQLRKTVTSRDISEKFRNENRVDHDPYGFSYRHDREPELTLPPEGYREKILDEGESKRTVNATKNDNSSSRVLKAELDVMQSPLSHLDLRKDLKSKDFLPSNSITTESVLYSYISSPFLVAANAFQDKVQTASTSSTGLSKPAPFLEVNLVLLVPDSDSFMFSRRRIISALDIAQQDLQTSGITSDFHIRFLFGNSQCSEILGPIRAFEFVWKHQVDAFLGPACDYSAAPVARYAAYWRIPVLTPGALSFDFVTNKKTQYRSLTKLGASLTSVALLLMKIMERYGWGKVLLVYDPVVHISNIPKLCFLAASAISYISKRHGVEAKPEFSGDPEKVLKSKVGTDYAGE